MGGDWGGYCKCPNGEVIPVGDGWDACGSLACFGGENLGCYKFIGEWSGKAAICGQKTKSIRKKSKEAFYLK